MKTITETIKVCADVESACCVVNAVAQHGSHAELIEASVALRALLDERRVARVLEAGQLKMRRNLKGALNLLAQEAGVPLEHIQSITINEN